MIEAYIGVRIFLLSRYGRLGASSHIRSMQYLPYFNSNGIQVDVCPLFSDNYLQSLYSGKSRTLRVFAGYWRSIKALSGHRRLFNHISEIESGMVAGPGTTLVWAIENFAHAFMEKPLFHKIVKIIIRIFFGWIKYFDLLLKDKPAAMDGASCTYLFGRKIEGKITDNDIIARYVGAKNMKHT